MTDADQSAAIAVSDEVISSRIAQPYIRRPRIEDLFDAHSAARVLLVRAGAGWGKTRAVRDWLAHRAATDERVLWLDMEAGAGDRDRFWRNAAHEVVMLPFVRSLSRGGGSRCSS